MPQVLGTRSPCAGGAKALRLVAAAAQGGSLRHRLAQQGVVPAHADRQDRVVHLAGRVQSGTEPRKVIEVESGGLPRINVLQLFGKLGGVVGQIEGLGGQQGRGGVVAVPTPLVARKAGDDHVGLKLADDPHHVGHNLVFVPQFQGFVGGFRVAEVDGPGKELLAAVEAAGLDELLGAHHAEQLANLRTDQVLSAVATGERQIAGVHQAGLRQVADHHLVLVVGMRRYVERAAQHVEFVQRQLNLAGRQFGRGLRPTGSEGKQ